MSKYCISVCAGPILSQADAEKKCPIICSAHLGTWTGKWKTIIPNEMSVCECELDTENNGETEFVIDVIAGKIWNEDDARVKCPIICESYGGKWTGGWYTPQDTWGKMSVCKCKFKF